MKLKSYRCLVHYLDEDRFEEFIVDDTWILKAKRGMKAYLKSDERNFKIVNIHRLRLNDMNYYMNDAYNEAYIGIKARHGGPFGCVIVKDNKIVGCGHNTVIRDNDPTCHGEMNAIRDACNNLGTFDLSGCELYTTSEPCPMCKCAIMWANIKKVYYGCTVQDAADIGFRDVDFETQSPEMICVDRDECLDLFEMYSEDDKATHY